MKILVLVLVSLLAAVTLFREVAPATGHETDQVAASIILLP
ncbi:MAG TPA: hypothetical protein VMV83_12110 [Rectinemataceae bacterium]|nr:hypothetical protein [Rectinemataceae bacterium]